MGSVNSFADEIDDPKYYETVLQAASFDQELIADFPKHIPEAADAVRFAYAPQLAQGG